MKATKKNIAKFYEILNIPLSSTKEEIKKAYKRLANKHHPDKEGGDEEMFKLIKDAYDTILEFIEKNPGFHAQSVNAPHAEPELEAEEPKQRDPIDVFIDEFAFKAASKTREAWEYALRDGHRKKCAIYSEFLRMIDDVGRDVATRYLVSAKGTLGAEIAAAVKRAKRLLITMILDYINVKSEEVRADRLSNLTDELRTASTALSLNIEQIFDFDITPTLANHYSFEVIGRGLDKAFLNKAFGKPGRTAADKTKTTLDDMSDFIVVTQKIYSAIYSEMLDLHDELASSYAMFTAGEKEARE